MTTKPWASVPPDLQKRWNDVFAASRNGVDVGGPCPVCGEHQLHRYYQSGRPTDRVSGGQRFGAFGGLWQWCSHCRTYEHSSALVPDWWRCDVDVDERQLTAQPDAIESALQRRRP